MSEAAEPVTPTTDLGAAPTGKPSIKERYQSLLAEYGAIAMVTYLSIFAVSIMTFAALIKFGFTDSPEGAGAEAGIWFSAWIATKVIQPGRIIATLALTPVVATAWRRFRPPVEDPETETAAPEGTAE